MKRRRGVINFNLIRFARSWRFIATYASPVFHEQIRVSGGNGQRWALQKKPNSILYGIIQIKAPYPFCLPPLIPSRGPACGRCYGEATKKNNSIYRLLRKSDRVREKSVLTVRSVRTSTCTRDSNPNGLIRAFRRPL